MQKPVISTQSYLCMECNHVLTTTNQHTNQIYCTAVSTLSCDLAMVSLFFFFVLFVQIEISHVSPFKFSLQNIL